MKHRKSNFILFITLISLVFLTVLEVQSAYASTVYLESDDLRDVYIQVKQKSDKYGPKEVLVVFDIDNTLLANDTDFGSDQWFDWQSDLIKKEQFEQAVAGDFNGLIDIQAMLYALGSMHKSQVDAEIIINKIKSLGGKVMALTARGYSTRNATIRELKRNGLSFEDSAIGMNAGFGFYYFPYNLDKPENDGFSVEEINLWGLKKPRLVSYFGGILMSAGQHKGAMLRQLLFKTKEKFKAIIFVDDKKKNIDKMAQGFEQLPVDLINIRYTKEDGQVLRFIEGTKEMVNRQWKVLSNATCEVFLKNCFRGML